MVESSLCSLLGQGLGETVWMAGSKSTASQHYKVKNGDQARWFEHS